MGCPLCESTRGELLQAGSIVTWIRCRSCGIDYMIPTEGYIEDEPTVDDEMEVAYNTGQIKRADQFETWPLKRRKVDDERATA